MLVVVIDNLVLNIAIPSLIRDLGAGNADIQWIVDAYILVFAGLLLTAGSLSDRDGRRRALIAGIAIFGVASLVATLCRTPGQLIACAGRMGAGAAFLFPDTSDPDHGVRRHRAKKAIAIWSSVLMLGALGAPLVGGLLLAALLVGLDLPAERPGRRARHRRRAGDHPGVAGAGRRGPTCSARCSPRSA